tara:strand:- start:322 stop:969 length:648 start_codon:yes stop_codon:yes gene_type:complete
MKDISVSKIFGKAWELFKANGSDLVVVTFIYVFLSSTLSIVDSLTEGSPLIIVLIISIICGIAQMILALGFNSILLNTVDGNKFHLQELFNKRSPTLIFQYIVGSILSGVAIVLGFIFLIIPGIYLAIRLQYFTLCILEQEVPDCGKALNESWNMTEGHVLDLFSLGILSICLVILGLIALFVGLFVAIPVAGLMSAVAYRIMKVNLQEKLPLQL